MRFKKKLKSSHPVRRSSDSDAHRQLSAIRNASCSSVSMPDVTGSHPTLVAKKDTVKAQLLVGSLLDLSDGLQEIQLGLDEA
ncbi:hypothetical protein NDU88_004153 [Pleurodeles waltl]|uniref:Uncharacterized protein n=1 Tax=Pleurodeles waltl TaxID=8319 RepID=A0AAV7QB32_PLEWA|nr:hypothetical protein NDU88_004153 [Pleurodeles waltl]